MLPAAKGALEGASPYEVDLRRWAAKPTHASPSIARVVKIAEALLIYGFYSIFRARQFLPKN